MLRPLFSGVYRHYKGQHYLVLGYGRYSDGPLEGKPCVIYTGLELDEAKAGPRIQVRSAEDWFQRVTPHGVTASPMMASVPRFTYVGPSWEPGD